MHTVGLAWLLCGAATSVASDSEPRVQAIQSRKYVMRHEYTVWVGTLPMDAFTKGLTFSGSYALHLNDILAWEAAHFTYSVGVNTRLADELAALVQPVGPTPFEVVQFYGTSNLVFKPLYGKMAVLNRKVIHQEMSMKLGVGVGRLTLSTRPVIDVGVGWRVFLDQHASLVFDLRDTVFIAADDLHTELWLGAGLSLSFGGREG